MLNDMQQQMLNDMQSLIINKKMYDEKRIKIYGNQKYVKFHIMQNKKTCYILYHILHKK